MFSLNLRTKSCLKSHDLQLHFYLLFNINYLRKTSELGFFICNTEEHKQERLIWTINTEINEDQWSIIHMRWLPYTAAYSRLGPMQFPLICIMAWRITCKVYLYNFILYTIFSKRPRDLLLASHKSHTSNLAFRLAAEQITCPPLHALIKRHIFWWCCLIKKRVAI